MAPVMPMISGEQNSPISSELDLQHTEKKKRPHSTTSKPGSCLKCSLVTPIQYGAEKNYASSVRCYHCNNISKCHKIDDDVDLHIIDHPKSKCDSPQGFRYFPYGNNINADMHRSEILNIKNIVLNPPANDCNRLGD